VRRPTRPLTGRDHAGVAEVQARRAFGGLVDDDRAFQLLDQRGLGVDLLAGDGILFQQGLEALQRHARAVELGFVALALAAGLHQGHFKLARVYGGQQLAGFDHLAFLEEHFFHHARDLRPYPDGGLRGDGAQGVQHDRDVGPLGGGHADRGGRCAAPSGGKAAGAAGRVGGRMCQVPGQPAYAGQGDQGDHAADDGRAAAYAFAGEGFGFRVHQLSLGARRANLVVRHFFVFDGVLAAVRGKPGSLLQTALNNYHCNTEGTGIAPERGA
jgi:hypothetical protein